jgi:hypothetical protein
MMRSIWAMALAGAVAACDATGGGDPTPSSTTAATPTATASAAATTASSGARAVAEETDDFLFEYAYPSEAGRIPELATLLDVELEQKREELARESVEARRDARSNGFPYNKHSYAAEWQVVADLPGWLSLSQDIATYTGGAHGNSTRRSLVWNKEADEAMEAIALFASPAALEQALGERFCEDLDRERARRREASGADNPGSGQFDECPRIDELEVFVGSSNRRTFDRLTLYAGPYVAGPYAEGAYEVDLTVDRAILDAVKPEHRAAFSARN